MHCILHTTCKIMFYYSCHIAIVCSIHLMSNSLNSILSFLFVVFFHSFYCRCFFFLFLLFFYFCFVIVMPLPLSPTSFNVIFDCNLLVILSLCFSVAFLLVSQSYPLLFLFTSSKILSIEQSMTLFYYYYDYYYNERMGEIRMEEK